MENYFLSSRNLWIIFGASLIFFILPLCGCGRQGPARAPVNGRVTLDGKPLETGLIRFIPIEGTSGPASGGEIIQGEYSVRADKGPVYGKYKVEIISNQKTGEKRQIGPEKEDFIEIFTNVVPEKYNTATILSAEISPGKNIFNFDLSTK